MKFTTIPNNLKEDLIELQDMESILTTAIDQIYTEPVAHQEHRFFLLDLKYLILKLQNEIRICVWKALPGIPKGEEFLQFRAKTSQYVREFRELGDKLKIV